MEICRRPGFLIPLGFLIVWLLFGTVASGGGGSGSSSPPLAFELPLQPVAPPPGPQPDPSPTTSPSPSPQPTTNPTASPSPTPTSSPSPLPTTSPSPSPSPTPPGQPSSPTPFLRTLPERSFGANRYLVLSEDQQLNNDLPRSHETRSDVYFRDLLLGTLRLVTGVADGPSWAPSVSGDGRFVVFLSRASNLGSGAQEGVVNAFLWERLSGTFHCLTPDTPADTFEVTISADGSTIALSTEARLLPTDTDDLRDI